MRLLMSAHEREFYAFQNPVSTRSVLQITSRTTRGDKVAAKQLLPDLKSMQKISI